MPGFDRTGPLGGGPRTGWGRGYCTAGTGAGRINQSGMTRGLGRGGIPWGGGRGRCFGGRGVAFARAFPYSPPTSPAYESESLRNSIAEAREAIVAMEARLSDLEKEK